MAHLPSLTTYRSQNLARAKALEFGHHHLVTSQESPVELESAAATDGDDVVATIAEDSGDSDEQRFRPRGLCVSDF
jgi:hypothetical protein